MSRYIDADALKASINTAFLSEIGKIIDTAPSIDIVRCKECKHWHKWNDGEMFCGHFDGGVGSDADDFCSYGERRTDG